MNAKPKIFCGRFEPQKGALKKDGTLPVYVTSVHAKNKSIAQTLLHAEFLKFLRDRADDYFKPKVWESCGDVPGVVPGAGFHTDFFDNGVIWNAEKGEPERVGAPSETQPETADTPAAEEPLKQVKGLGTHNRAAALALYGPVTEITGAEYGAVIDLMNNDAGGFTRELAEAVAREPRVLELLPERQTQLLEWLKAECPETAQWTDIKKAIVKWLDTPPAKRDSTDKTPSGATLGGTGKADRIAPNDKITLEYEIALGIVSRSMDFDIYNPPLGIELRANTMLEENKNPELKAWREKLLSTPGILDYSRAAIIAMIKTAPDTLWMAPGQHRNYISRTLTEVDHANPDPLIVDIACGRSSAPLPQPVQNQGVSSEEPADTRPDMTERQIEIARAINDLLSGCTNVMDKDGAEVVVCCTGHLISDIVPALMDTIMATESCLSPAFSDEEIHVVGTAILDAWSDNQAEREKIATDAIVEYRSEPDLPQPAVIDPPVLTAKPKKTNEPALQQIVNLAQPAALTYQQLLTIAALQGLCANPVYGNAAEDLPFMARDLAAAIVRQQELSRDKA